MSDGVKVTYTIETTDEPIDCDGNGNLIVLDAGEPPVTRAFGNLVIRIIPKRGDKFPVRCEDA